VSVPRATTEATAEAIPRYASSERPVLAQTPPDRLQRDRFGQSQLETLGG